MIKILYCVFFIALFSCGSSEAVTKPKEGEKKKGNELDALFGIEDSKKVKSDDELLNMLEKKDGKKTDVKKNENVAYETIEDNATDKTTEKTTEKSTEVVKPQDKKEDVKTNPVNDQDKKNTTTQTNAVAKQEVKEDVKSLKEELQKIKNDTQIKDQKIFQLAEQNTSLAKRNQELENQKGQSKVVYQSSGSGTAISAEEYEGTYGSVYQMFLDKNYQGSLEGFQNLLANEANHPLADNAQYWIGECYFALKNYSQAVLEFEKVFTFANSNKLEDAQFKIGYCYHQLKDKVNGKAELQRFTDKYPNSRNIERAKKMMNEL
jgi:TolA-binding protein